MEKKEMMLHIINVFTEHAQNAPEELLNKLNQVKYDLNQLTNEQIELLDGPSTVVAAEKPYDPTNPLEVLFDAYGEMEKFAYSGEKNQDLYSVIQQMRGFFDIPDRYYP